MHQLVYILDKLAVIVPFYFFFMAWKHRVRSGLFEKTAFTTTLERESKDSVRSAKWSTCPKLALFLIMLQMAATGNTGKKVKNNALFVCPTVLNRGHWYKKTRIVIWTETWTEKSQLARSWPLAYLQSVEELDLGPPNANLFSGREEDLHSGPPDYKCSALKH